MRLLTCIFCHSVRERLKEVLRQYELRERHFECVVRSKELEVLLSRARAAEQKQLADAEKARADKTEDEVCYVYILCELAHSNDFYRINSFVKSWMMRQSSRLLSSISYYHAVKRYAHIPHTYRRKRGLHSLSLHPNSPMANERDSSCSHYTALYTSKKHINKKGERKPIIGGQRDPDSGADERGARLAVGPPFTCVLYLVARSTTVRFR